MSSDTTVSAFEHVKRGDADYFQTLEMDVLKNSRDKHRYSLLSFARRKRGNSLLAKAARYGELSCCQVIYRRCPQLLYERNKKGNTPLHHAAYNGRNEVIKFLLTARATVEQEAKGTKIEGEGGVVVETILIDEELLMMVSDQKETALHFAAVEGHLESVKFLLEADRSKKLLGMVDDYKRTALHLAVKYHHLEIVELLVEADPDFEYSVDIFGKTSLFMAWERALSGDQKTADIRKLLIRKQPTQCQLPIGDNNWTLIHHAAHKGDISAVKEIIHFWPDCSELVDKEGQNFLHLAVKFEKVKILKYILELRNIADNVLNGKDNYGNTPLHLATTSANQSIALALLDDPRINKMTENKQGRKALDMASSLLLEEFMKGMYPIQCARRGDVDFFRAIHVDVLRESKDEDGESVLSIAARKGHLNCCEVIFEKCPELLYQTTKDKITILHTAASNGKDDIVKFLLSTQHKMGQQGVKNVGSGAGEGKNDNKLLMMVSDVRATALHFAAYGGHLESAKLLIEADRSKKLLGMVDDYKRTVLHVAVKYHHLEIVEVLIEADPDFEYFADDEGKTPLFIAWEKALSGDQRRAHIRKLLTRIQPTQCQLPMGDNKWTLIHHATHEGDITAVKEIIHFWPDCSQLVDKEGQNFLHLAVKFEKVNILKYILELRNIGDSVLNGKDNYGNTPLHLATISMNRSIALALLDDPRVNKMVENKQGKNPLDIVSSVLEGELIKVMYPIQCARKGDVDFFRAIHVDVLRESKDEDGESVLSIAVRKSHLNCCEVIFEKCPELLYQTTPDKITILHTAASNGKDDIVKFLLSTQYKMGQQGVKNVGSGGEEGKNDNKLLMMLSDNHRTALHFAVEKGHFMSAKLLIEASPSNELSRSVDIHKETAMHVAVKRHHLDIVKLLVEADPEFDYSANDSGHTPLFIALQEALSGDQITVEIKIFIIQKQPKQCKVGMGTNGWTVLHHATSKGDLSAIEEITLFCPDCSELVDNEKRNFLHLAIKFERENLVKIILDLPNISDNILNGQDINGDTPLHIATSKGHESMALTLLYHHRVRKIARNKLGKSALDAINFDYDKRRAGVLGLVDLVDEKELKDRSEFDLLVGALISTVSFTAGITVPGGYITDGPNRGNAILYKKRTFEAFVVFNTIALALSLFAVFSHFCMKRLVNKKDIIYQLKVARFSSIGAIFAMMVAFITGSFAVLSISLGLAITVCGICCCFFGFSFYSLWRMKSQKTRGYQVV